MLVVDQRELSSSPYKLGPYKSNGVLQLRLLLVRVSFLRRLTGVEHMWRLIFSNYSAGIVSYLARA